MSSDLGRSINSLKVSKQFGFGAGSLHTSYCLCSVVGVVREFVYQLNLWLIVRDTTYGCKMR